MNNDPENNLDNHAIDNPVWECSVKRELMVVQPKKIETSSKHTRLPYVFIGDMHRYIGKVLKFTADDYLKDWWHADVGYLWHSSWLAEL